MNDEQRTGDENGTSWLSRLRDILRGEPSTREELLEFLRDERWERVLDADELEMLRDVLEVSETQVRDVMVPRSQMVVIEAGAPREEILQTIIECGHSRFPVLGEERDEVVGILLAKDLLRYFMNAGAEAFDLARFLRPAVFIPESKRLNTLLKQFRVSRNHMAIVVDEYGGIAGLLTIEDVLEEIVGEIDDEHDIEEDEFIRPDGERDGRPSFAVRALTRIEDFNEFFGCELDDQEYDTVGGLVLHELGRLPRRGEHIDFGGFQFAVTKADKRRIDLLQVQRQADAL